MNTYVADTHALIFYLSEPGRLGNGARNAFAEAASGQAEIILPVIIFAELIFAVEHGRVQADVRQIVDRVQEIPYFHIAPLTLERLLTIQKLVSIQELHDRIIVAETLACTGTLITRDARVRQAGVVPTVW